MQTIAFGGLAVCLLLVTAVDTVWAAIGILCLGKLFGAAGIGGFNVNHMDVAPRHAGTLMGITNTAGTIPGIVGVAVGFDFGIRIMGSGLSSDCGCDPVWHGLLSPICQRRKRV